MSETLNKKVLKRVGALILVALVWFGLCWLSPPLGILFVVLCSATAMADLYMNSEYPEWAPWGFGLAAIAGLGVYVGW